MQILNTKSFPEISRGLFAAAIDDALSQIHKDLVDRPGNKKPRSLTIKLNISAIPDEDNNDILASANIEFQVTHKVPPQSMKRRLKSIPGRNGLGFETDTDSISHAHNQRVFPELSADSEISTEAD